MTTHSRALILYRRRRFINHLLTYLLTYVPRPVPVCVCVLLLLLLLVVVVVVVVNKNAFDS